MPSLRKLGVDLVIGLWQALHLPARARRAMERLNAAAMWTQAARPEPSTPEGLAALQAAERGACGAVVRALGVTVEQG